jgi:hypothetical protein
MKNEETGTALDSRLTLRGGAFSQDTRTSPRA